MDGLKGVLNSSDGNKRNLNHANVEIRLKASTDSFQELKCRSTYNGCRTYGTNAVICCTHIVGLLGINSGMSRNTELVTR